MGKRGKLVFFGMVAMICQERTEGLELAGRSLFNRNWRRRTRKEVSRMKRFGAKQHA